MNELDSIFDNDDSDIFGEDTAQENQERQEPQIPSEPANYAEPVEPRELDSIFDDEDNVDSNASAVDKYLQSKGFKNSEVTIYDENEQEVKVNFHELSSDEQLDILSSITTKEKGPQLKEDEQEWINELRKNNLDFDGFLELYKNSIMEELGATQEDSYEIDAYDDKELFLLDLKNKYDLTDEELQSELEKELQNEELFEKKVAKTRAEYKELETQYKQMQEQEFAQQQEQEYQQFAQQMVGIATNINEFHGLELEDDDKNDTLSYMLDLDDNGVSQLARDLQDPEKLYAVAWYLKHGNDAFKIIENAHESEISKLRALRDKPNVVRQESRQGNRVKHMNEL